MKITMRVNGASHHPTVVPVEYNGETAMATISMLDIEMHDEGTNHGSWSIRASKQSEVTALKEKFKPGSLVTIDTDAFEVVSGAAEEPASEPEAAPAQ